MEASDNPFPAEYVVLVSVPLIVISSLAELVVIVIFEPAIKVTVSLFESADTVFCPETAKFLKMLCAEPVSELAMVTVPEPFVTVMPAP